MTERCVQCGGIALSAGFAHRMSCPVLSSNAIMQPMAVRYDRPRTNVALDRREDLAAEIRNALGVHNDDSQPVVELVRQLAAIVAHVQEREVELMALAMFAGDYEVGYSNKRLLKMWRNAHLGTTLSLRNDARALRDAFDQMGEGET